MSRPIKPDMLCLVLPLPWSTSTWNGAVVRAIEPIPRHEVERDCSDLSHLDWWYCEAADGVGRMTTLSIMGVDLDTVISTTVCLPERYLMPLDPDVDLKAEPSLYSIPVPKPGTRKVPVINARSI